MRNGSSFYVKEFSLKKTLRIASLIVVIYLIREYFYRAVSKFIIAPFGIDQIKQSTDLDVLALFIICGCLFRIIFLLFWKKQRPSVNSWINIGLITAGYLLIIRLPNVFTFVSIKLVPSIAYLDIALFAFLFFITKFRYYSYIKLTDSIRGFIEDDFNPEKNADILGRKQYATQVGLKILGTSPLEKAFVIAINSPWGFGKSGFLLLIEQFFQEKRSSEFVLNAIRYSSVLDVIEIHNLFTRQQDVIIVRYNPWKNFDNRKVVQDFFDELSTAISKYDSQLSQKVKSYAAFLNKLDESIFAKVIELAIDAFQSEQTLLQLFEEINISIKRIQKRIIVFVDDLDRLTGDELVDILKLIRNTGNFANTFFILAYDHNYVLNTIDKQNLISFKEEYLHKIVQLEVVLPIFKRNILLQFLEQQIREYSNYDFDKIRFAINEISTISVLRNPAPGTSQSNPELIAEYFFRLQEMDDSLIFAIFRNPRDVVRFVNSFKLSFDAIGAVADVYEIILLEILKVKYLSIYQLVSNKRFLKVVDQKYDLDDDEFDRFMNENTVKLININVADVATLKVLLRSIFNPQRKIYFRSVKYPIYFDIYFTYQSPKLFQLKDIEEAIRSRDIDKIIGVIDESVKTDTVADLRNFVDSQTEFGQKSDFETILKVLFYIAKYGYKEKGYHTVFQVRSMLRNKSVIDRFYKNTPDELSNLLLSILKDNRYDLVTRSEIAWDELYKIVNKDEQIDGNLLINNKEELQRILLQCFKEKINLANGFEPDIFSFYIKNLENIELGTRRIIITADANHVMHEFIKKFSYDYFKYYFLRKHPEPASDGQYFHLDPFILYYFNNQWDEIYKQLQSVRPNFQRSNDERAFYNFLNDALILAKSNLNEKFLIKDKDRITLAENVLSKRDIRLKFVVPSGKIASINKVVDDIRRLRGVLNVEENESDSGTRYLNVIISEDADQNAITGSIEGILDN